MKEIEKKRNRDDFFLQNRCTLITECDCVE